MNFLMYPLKLFAALCALWAFFALLLLVGWWRHSCGEPPVESEGDE